MSERETSQPPELTSEFVPEDMEGSGTSDHSGVVTSETMSYRHVEQVLAQVIPSHTSKEI